MGISEFHEGGLCILESTKSKEFKQELVAMRLTAPKNADLYTHLLYWVTHILIREKTTAYISIFFAQEHYRYKATQRQNALSEEIVMAKDFSNNLLLCLLFIMIDYYYYTILVLIM